MGIPVRIAPRLLAVWIGISTAAGAAGAAQVASRGDERPAAVSTYGPAYDSTTTEPTVAVTAPPSTDTTAAPSSSVPRVTSTTKGPAATSPSGPATIDGHGMWIGSMAGGPARNLGGECTNGVTAWQHDGSSVDQEGLAFGGGHPVTRHGLDGSTTTIGTGYDLVRNADADVAVWRDRTTLRVVVTDSDLRSHRVEIPYPNDLSAPSFVIRPDGKAILVQAGDQLAIYGRDGHLLQPWAPAPAGVITYTSDARWMLLWNEASGVTAARPDGSDLHRADIAWVPQRLALGPGSQLAYIDTDPDRDSIPNTTGTTVPNDSFGRTPLVVVDVATGTSRRIVTGEMWEVAWSPRGGPILFTGTRDGVYGVWSVNPDGSNLRLLAKGERYREELPEIHDWTYMTYSPRFVAISPDGKQWAACA